MSHQPITAHIRCCKLIVHGTIRIMGQGNVLHPSKHEIIYNNLIIFFIRILHTCHFTKIFHHIRSQSKRPHCFILVILINPIIHRDTVIGIFNLHIIANNIRDQVSHHGKILPPVPCVGTILVHRNGNKFTVRYGLKFLIYSKNSFKRRSFIGVIIKRHPVMIISIFTLGPGLPGFIWIGFVWLYKICTHARIGCIIDANIYCIKPSDRFIKG